jgi:hypothetical protein
VGHGGDVPGNSVEKTGVGCPRLSVNPITQSKCASRRTFAVSPTPLRGSGDTANVRKHGPVITMDPIEKRC